MTLIRSSTYYVEPGYVYFSRRATLLRAVVGSCVAVCLWDERKRVGGMNHFLMPAVSDRENATPRFGNVAVAALVKIMEEAGSRRSDLVAQILGGGAPAGAAHPSLGERNVRAARDALTRKGIRIISEDIGGTVGRKIVFDTSNGELAVLKVHQIRESDWYA
ncbi:MAG: hypothetical protein AMXMBFR82_01100 [Candidatus Hydrogenedentota bacterium]